MRKVTLHLNGLRAGLGGRCRSHAVLDLRCHRDERLRAREMGISLPNSQRQHRTLHIQKDVLPYALC